MTVMRPKPIIGVYEKPFWEHVQKRELRLQCCANGHFRYPPGPCCPKCLSTDYSWEKASGHGNVISWTVFHRQYFPDLSVPYIVMCGALKEGPLLVANFVGDHGQPLKLICLYV